MINWSLSLCSNFTVPLTRQRKHHQFDSWCRSPTGDFCTDKSHQKPSRGHPLTTPFSERKIASVSLFGTPSKRTSCLCPAAASAHTTVSLYLCFGVPDFGAESAKTQLYKALPSKGSELIYRRRSGSGARRFAVTISKCRKQNHNESTL